MKCFLKMRKPNAAHYISNHTIIQLLFQVLLLLPNTGVHEFIVVLGFWCGHKNFTSWDCGGKSLETKGALIYIVITSVRQDNTHKILRKPL